MRWALLFGAAYVSFACDDPLKPVERVEDFRVLGARVEVDGDPARAAPAPGEAATVRWLVAAPGGPPPVAWALAACLARETNVGVPLCDGEPFASAVSTAPDAALPELAFAIPADVDPVRTPRVAVLGSICEGGSPEGTPFDSDCPSGAPGTKVSLEFELARPDDTNTNPRFDDPAIELDGSPWPATSAESESCASGALPTLSAGSASHSLSIAMSADARDPLPRETELDPVRESLLLSHFTTAGELDRAFSSITADESELRASVPWLAPETVEPDGLVVRFWFVARDLRGGSDFTSRALCVLP